MTAATKEYRPPMHLGRRRRPSRPRALAPAFSLDEAPQQPLDLDTVTAQWRVALDAAEDALRAAGASGLGRLSADELRGEASSLAEERSSVAGLLDAVARENRVRLRRPLSAPRATTTMVGLPAGTRACIFDLDGVLTASAELHAAAWAHTFDEFLARRADRAGALAYLVRPFDVRADYLTYVHGRPRLDGVRAFLASRGINLPAGRPDDAAGAETVYGLANRKNEVLRRLLESRGVVAFEGSRRYLHAAREAGLRCAVVSPSLNTAEILARAGLDGLVDRRVDGEAMARDVLRPKPAADTLLAACRLLGTRPEDAAAFETTQEGMVAAQAAGIETAVAIDRTASRRGPRRPGAGVVVADLEELLDPALRG